MGIRMSGLISGLDTESIIKELMKAQNTKKTKIENKITKHEWKQEKWAELNKKIYALYTGSLNKVKTQGNYLAKKVTSSDETKLSATANSSAVTGTHQVQVKQMANSQFVSSLKLDKTVTNDKGETVPISGSTKLKDLGFDTSSTSKETVVRITSGDKQVDLSITDETTINDFLSACKEAGLNASYDTAQKRFFIGASGSGVENAFSIETVTMLDKAERQDIRDLIDYSKLNSTFRQQADDAMAAYKNAADDDERNAALDTLNALAANKVSRDLTEKYKKGELADVDLEKVKKDAEDAYLASLKDGETPDEDDKKKAVEKAVDKAATEYVKGVKEAFDKGAGAGNPYYDTSVDLGQKLAAFANVQNAESTDPADQIPGNNLENIGLTNITFTKNDNGTVTYDCDRTKLSLQEATDSIINYNGVELINGSNNVSVNGLTLELKGVTTESLSINVSKDTSAVYDMVKDFIKQYNEVLGEMNDAYNADSARGYEPLTSEEREAMTEEQIEKWENKIKDSLLRRDDTLSSLVSTMRTIMQGAVSYNGKTYTLGSLGIGTTDYAEYGKLHINGDEDDASVSDKTNKLKAAIDEDPEKVMTILSTVAGKLYDAMQEKMKSTKTSSAFTFYNDKTMTKDLKTYKDDLKKMESKLKDIEDRYYKQFTAMETAMAKLNSQTNSLAALMGMSTGQ